MKALSLMSSHTNAINILLGWLLEIIKKQLFTCAHAKLLQSCLTLCKPMDYSLPGSFVHGDFQARRLEWVAISISRGSSWVRCQICLSCIDQQIH